MAHIVTKFDWLAGIDTTPIADQLTQIVRRQRIQRLAPSYGCVIEGERLVATVVERTLEALRRIADLPRPRPLGDFKWPSPR